MAKAFTIKPDREWIDARRELLRRVKAEVEVRLGLGLRGADPDIKRYHARFTREFAGRWSVSTKAELFSEIESADIVYGGDFHAFGQAQRAHLRLLRSLSDKRPVVIALECFAANSQKWLDRYLKGEINTDELKAKSRWRETWGFPWENYRAILELAQARGFSLLALNVPGRSRGKRAASPSLTDRDAFAALRIRDVIRRKPGSLVYVIYGDLHLAAAHLPERVREELRIQKKRLPSGTKGFKDVVVHLNSERIYFQLAEKGLELSTDVVRLGRSKTGSRFCVMSSPPWVQWQSYILFLEKNENEFESTADGFSRSADSADEADEFDPTDQVAFMVKVVTDELGLDVKLHDLNVYSAGDNRIWQILERKLKRDERVVARSLVARGRNFLLPQAGCACLGQPDVNHAAGLAGRFVHAQVSKLRRPAWNMPKDFAALIWIEAVSYFISKLINHKRLSETFADLKAQLAFIGPTDSGRDVLRLALDRLMSELVFARTGRWRRPKYIPRQKSSYFEAARILGGMMGERLYLAYRSRKLNKEEIRRLLKKDATARGFNGDYESIVRLLTADEVRPGRKGEE